MRVAITVKMIAVEGDELDFDAQVYGYREYMEKMRAKGLLGVKELVELRYLLANEPPPVIHNGVQEHGTPDVI